MKRISKILLSLICILGFTTCVNAASNTITAYKSGTKYEYINGLPVYYNRSSSYALYVLDADTYYTANTSLVDPVEVDKGFAYIINNSKVTNDTYKNYYIAQIAILWYEDYLNGNNANISSSMKESISSKTSDTVCYYITKLVNNAKNYSKNGNLINFIDDKITFTKNGSYYYSNVIDVEVNGLNTKPSVSLYNAPSSATIINNTITNNGTGSFQIRIPVSSLTNIEEKDFIVNVTGTGYNYTYYKYSNGTNDAIYAYSYSTNSGKVEASMVAQISGNYDSVVRIKVIDNDGDYISGIKYYIYSGNCVNDTCYNDDLVYSFTTKNIYTELENILSEGSYTLVRTTETNYVIPKKVTFSIKDTNNIQTVIIDENDYDNNYDNDYDKDYNNNQKYGIKIYNTLNDSTNIIKIYNSNETLVDSFRADQNVFETLLYPGKYSLVDTKDSLVDIAIEVTNDGKLYIYVGNTKKEYSYIQLSDFLKRTTQVEDENINYDENGNIHIDNLDGVGSIDISNKVETSTKVEWLNNIIDCPITSLSSTIKYIVGAIIVGVGILLVVRNVKKQKNNI